MPKYYCDYCDTYLTHDSPSVRKTHCSGRKHKENVNFYYQKWMEERAQSLIDATTAAFTAQKIAPKQPTSGLPAPPVAPTVASSTAAAFNPLVPPPSLMVPPPMGMLPQLIPSSLARQQMR
ncbi:U1 small nuclear ribonucleoprotein C-like [Panonychus citri]|uniref:U1 small nuclear ribonucleoprotein C-like n=1 Tax=Panonychus citri TaxID=50023 RepID=UPI0023074D20|nr:U1 small nuclear ribonucleoprotein C-like [Panonychus citri]